MKPAAFFIFMLFSGLTLAQVRKGTQFISWSGQGNVPFFGDIAVAVTDHQNDSVPQHRLHSSYLDYNLAFSDRWMAGIHVGSDGFGDTAFVVRAGIAPRLYFGFGREPYRNWFVTTGYSVAFRSENAQVLAVYSLSCFFGQTLRDRRKQPTAWRDLNGEPLFSKKRLQFFNARFGFEYGVGAVYVTGPGRKSVLGPGFRIALLVFTDSKGWAKR